MSCFNEFNVQMCYFEFNQGSHELQSEMSISWCLAGQLTTRWRTVYPYGRLARECLKSSANSVYIEFFFVMNKLLLQVVSASWQLIASASHAEGDGFDARGRLQNIICNYVSYGDRFSLKCSSLGNSMVSVKLSTLKFPSIIEQVSEFEQMWYLNKVNVKSTRDIILP